MSEVNREPPRDPSGQSASPGRTYGRQTRDERAADRRAALLEAAFDLVAEHGWPALRIDALCRAAGLNKRYFYESFATLDAVIAALTEDLAAQAIAVALAGIDGTRDPDAATRSAVSSFVAFLTDDPRRARVLFGAVPAGDAAAGHRTEAIRSVVAQAAMTGRRIHVLGDDATVDITAAMLVGGTSQVVLDWLDGQILASQDQLIESLILLWQVTGEGVAARLGAGLTH